MRIRFPLEVETIEAYTSLENSFAPSQVKGSYCLPEYLLLRDVKNPSLTLVLVHFEFSCLATLVR